MSKLTSGEEQELKDIQAVEKTVQIRLCNYSMLVRAQQFSSGLSAQLMALLGGYGSLLMGGESAGEGKVPKAIDDGEEQMLKTSKDKLEEEEKKNKEQREAEEEDDDW